MSKKKPTRKAERSRSKQGGASAASTAEGSALVWIAGAEASLGPEQKRFNKLSRQVENERKRLQRWQDALEQMHQRLHEEGPALLRAFNAAQREVVLLADQLLGAKSKIRGLTARRREGLREMLCDLARQILEPPNEPDPELQRILDFHDPEAADPFAPAGDEADGDPSADPANGAEDDAEGVDPYADPGFDEEDFSDWDRAEAEGRAQRGKRRAEEQRAVDERLGRESIREVYRQLASELHPDRESDPEEKARKTALMQKVNLAYRERDLLTLLRLQLELQQIDAAQLGLLPESRLARFNEVLQTQYRELRAAIREIAELASSMSEHGLFEVRRPEHLAEVVNAQFRQLKAGQQEMKRLHAALSDPERRPRTIDEVIASRREAAFMEELEDELFDILMEDLPVRHRPRR